MTQPLATCSLCGQGIYSVDDSTYYLVVDEATGKYTSDPTEIMKRGEDLDGRHIHIDCQPDPARLCIDNE